MNWAGQRPKVSNGHEGALHYSVATNTFGDSSRPSHIYCSDQDLALDPLLTPLRKSAWPAGPAPLGLLLDVDGPISSPVTRTVSEPGLAQNLTDLANAGIPIGFNTGRSDEFLLREVLPVMQRCGLHAGAPVWGISEKGGSWFSFSDPTRLEVDRELELPVQLRNDLRSLLQSQYDHLAFYDETKHTMVSFEQHTSISNEYFQEHRDPMELAVGDLVASYGLAYVWEGRPDRDWAPTGHLGPAVVRIDPTIIATDVEHVGTGKDTGAERFLKLLAAAGVQSPEVWRTVGDSRTDYAMAAWLKEHGFDVAHVDVRPADGILDIGVPVLTHTTLIHDQAGAAFVAAWAQLLLG